MIIKKFPKPFCKKGAVLKLKKRIDKTAEGKELLILPGTLFKVEDIIGYGFDLISLDEHKHEIRLLNSSMSEYFEKVGPPLS